MSAPNTTLGADCYVPILKSKQGELGAISTVGSSSLSQLQPLVEVRECSPKQAAALAAAWPHAQDTLFVHPLNVDANDDSSWVGDITQLFDALRSTGVPAIPVITLDAEPVIVTAISQICALDGRGVCIRVDSEEAALARPVVFTQEVDQLLSDLGLPPEKCDLLVDVGLVRNSIVARVTTAEAALRVVPYLNVWRNVICGFSAFPESLGDVAPPGAITPIVREDAAAWTAVASRNPPRLPIFADYAIGNPFYADVPWAPIPSIRYAYSDSWIIHRGATKQNRSAQYRQLTSNLVAASHFAGSAFSPGDEYFADVAAGSVGPGNPMTYVRAGTSRHLACVLDRLATIGVP